MSYGRIERAPRWTVVLGIQTASDRLERSKVRDKPFDRLRTLDDDEQEEVSAALKAGLSVSQLARIYNVSRMTIMGASDRSLWAGGSVIPAFRYRRDPIC